MILCLRKCGAIVILTFTCLISITLNLTELYINNQQSDSGGIIVFVRESLIKDDSILLLNIENDDVIWLRLDDITGTLDNIFLCFCYNLPTATSRQSFTEGNMFDGISHYMLYLQSLTYRHCKFIVCRNMNARVSDLKDFVEDDNSRHVYAPHNDYNPDNILPRSTKDKYLTQMDLY